jgi:glycosyltransferase involved in cell wall biosynthesis
MSDFPLISVIIPSYNSASWVVQSIESALSQTYSNIEVIVVDDGSTDDTRERLAPLDGRIRYFYQANGGVSRARNRGIKEARGDLIAFLDADDLWLPEKLAKQWECLRANPEAAVVHTDTYQMHEPGGTRAYLYVNRERFTGPCSIEFFWGNRVHTSTVLVTRASLERIGQFDEEIRWPSTEDLDLWLRIGQHYPFAFVNEPLVIYRHHATNGSLNLRVMMENEYYVLAKALKGNPVLGPDRNRERIQQRMFGLAFAAGYANAEVDNLRRARCYFRDAICYSPLSIKAWTFWASTLLPLRIRKGLRSMKQRVTLQRAG